MNNPINVAMQDAEDLLPWAKPNDQVESFSCIADIVRKSLGGPVEDGCEFSIPLMRVADVDDVPAVPLLRAVLMWEKSWMPLCVFCRSERHSGHRLTVLAGVSAVLLHFCPSCADRMNEMFTGLVWEISEEVYDIFEVPEEWEI